VNLRADAEAASCAWCWRARRRRPTSWARRWRA
jgi:hypothetical protein